MSGHIAKISLQQISALKGAGLKVKPGPCLYRIVTKNWGEVETLHRIISDPEHSPDFVNGDFRIYLAMLTRP
jgi:hypothetical protein